MLRHPYMRAPPHIYIYIQTFCTTMNRMRHKVNIIILLLQSCDHQFELLFFSEVSVNISLLLSCNKITASRWNCSTANCLGASAPKEARKSASKTHWRSPWNISVTPLISGEEQRLVAWSCQTWSKSLWNQKKRSNWAAQET